MANLTFAGQIGGPEELIDSPQLLTDSWQNLGELLDIGGSNVLILWLDIEINDSSNVQTRILAKCKEGNGEYVFPLQNINPNIVRIRDECIELDNDLDQKIIFVWELHGAIPFIQAQIYAANIGVTPARILTAYVTVAL